MKRSVKCDKFQTGYGCECQKIGIRPHFRRRTTEPRPPAEFSLYCIRFGEISDPVVRANLVPCLRHDDRLRNAAAHAGFGPLR